MTFAAVLDGHGGRDVARLASELLPQEAVKAGIGDTISAPEVSMQQVLTCLCTFVLQAAASCRPIAGSARTAGGGITQQRGSVQADDWVQQKPAGKPVLTCSQPNCFRKGVSPAIPQTPIHCHQQPITAAT